MGKISDYANVLKSKLTDLFVVYQRDNGELETKNATLEQLGDAICGEQVHATLETDDQTIIGGINENKDKVGSLSTLTTTDKSSIVGAVNEVNTGKVNVSDLTPKTFSTTTPISIQANETVTQQFTVNNAKYGIITGFAITSNLNVVALQFYFYNATTVQVRVKNVSNANDVFHISFFYI